MIDVEHLTKDYGTVVAVKDLSFSVGKGEVVGFLGPNGAGKSTTLRILAGFLGSTEGRVTINGFDIERDAIAARQSIGYMPEASPLYPEMRVREYLAFRAQLKKVAGRERTKAVERAMEQAAVTEMADTLILHLSKGYRQRVGMADALVAKPPLLILDEPTAGLDPNQIREVRSLVKDLGEDHTILLSTHILSEVESTCDRAIVIDRGKLIAEGEIEELRAQRRSNVVRVVVRDPEGVALKTLKGIEGVRRVKKQGGEDSIRVFSVVLGEDDAHGEVIESAMAALQTAGVGVREAAPEKATLEDVFAQLTRAEELEA